MNHTEEESIEESPKGKRGKSWLIVLLVLLGLCIAGFAGWRYYVNHDPHAMDMEAFAGSLPGKTEAEIQADLNRIIKEGEFNVAMSSVVSIKGDKGTVNIENIAANHYLMQVDITYPDPKTKKDILVYQSGIIKPGYSVGEATMKESLAHDGEGKMTAYDAVATFHALDAKTKREMGATRMNIVLAYENVPAKEN